jgi:hypothetical protein
MCRKRLYAYVGPQQIAAAVAGNPTGQVIAAAREVCDWIARSEQGPKRCTRFTATFVVDRRGRLRLAERHSEHVACAGGQPVLAAGEITFRLQGDAVDAESVTNQSTGYCPEPESWPAIAAALARAGIPVPDGSTTSFILRRCPACHATNLVRHRLFECAICAAPLPEAWNFALDPEQ